MILLLFPHQLLEHEPLDVVKSKGVTEVVMMEDPALYGDRKGSPHGPSKLKLNRMRILYMRVATKLYIEWLKRSVDRKVKVTHIAVDDLWKLSNVKRYAHLRGKDVIGFDPVDHLIHERMSKAKVNVTWLDSPCFLMGDEELQKYYQTLRKDHKRMSHAPFFEAVKRKLDILTHVQSMDENNRVPYPQKGGPPIPSPYVGLRNPAERKVMWENEVAWLKTSPFWKNPGPLHDPQLPLTHDEVREWLHKFIKERFAHFGKYEDAVVDGQPWMFHSGMSIYLNMGLIRPIDVVNVVRKLQKTNVNNVEGFLRQVMGWREFSRLYYKFVAPSTYLKNIFKHKVTPLPRAWYDTAEGSSTGFKVVDDAIKDAWQHGYLHHIRRLMVVSNFMTLNGVHPDHVFAWMYEFSLDSWDWVMVFNVYSMGTWSDGGYSMRKPYVSGASYLTKMAYMKERREVDEWNQLFHNFLRKHAEILLKTQLAGLVRKIM